ncbi:MAG: hypothetical protein QW182_07580, partial [Thermosphaera sp.]
MGLHEKWALVLIMTMLVAIVLSVDAVQLTKWYDTNQPPPPPPSPPMVIKGFVFIKDSVSGDNILAPEGLSIRIFRGTYQIYPLTGSINVTDSNGYYEIYLSGLENGDMVDLFVEEINVTRIAYQSMVILDLNITVIDTLPPTKPTNLLMVSKPYNNTPTFEWSHSTDNLRVKGYFIAINTSNGETIVSKTFIGNVTTWTTTEPLDWGDYIVKVWAIDMANNEGEPAEMEFEIIPPGTPYVVLLANVTTGYAPATVRFDVELGNFAVVDQALMSFGDGVVENVTGYCQLSNYTCSFTITHVYDSPGDYTVLLSVTGRDIIARIVTVNASRNLSLLAPPTITVTETSTTTQTTTVTSTTTVTETSTTTQTTTVTSTTTVTETSTTTQTTTVTSTTTVTETSTTTQTTIMPVTT